MIRQGDIVRYVGIAFGPLQQDKTYKVVKASRTTVAIICTKKPTDVPLIVPRHEVKPFMRLYRRAA